VSPIVRVTLAAALLALCACHKKKAEPAPSDAPKLKPKPAVLIGSVRLEQGYELPSYSPEAMERVVLSHVKGGTFPEMCTPPRLDDRQPVQLTPDGKLINVMVAASEFSKRPEPTIAKVHQIEIKDCRLTPKMIVAQINDMVQIKNDVDFPFMPGMGSDTFSQTLTLNQTRDIKLETGGVKILSCGFTAPCGRTDLIVLAHPYGAVTDAKGEFRIEDFPADETVKLNAWHPLFAETFIMVKVAQGEEKRVELVLTPKPPPKPRKPVVKEPGVIYPD
jgi:hypothetical protein